MSCSCLNLGEGGGQLWSDGLGLLRLRHLENQGSDFGKPLKSLSSAVKCLIPGVILPYYLSYPNTKKLVTLGSYGGQAVDYNLRDSKPESDTPFSDVEYEITLKVVEFNMAMGGKEKKLSRKSHVPTKWYKRD